MKIGLQIPYLTFPGGPPKLGETLGEMAKTAEDAGFSSVWMMDHFFQIPFVGDPTLDMLEVYTSLGYLAAHTKKVRLGALVTGVTYRHPGILAKQVTTLDVLSGGRAYLGIGAAWFDREHHGLGVPFPPLKERFERLEEALQIVHQMFGPDNGPYNGKHYQLAETMNVPAPISQPHPPILIGGSGEKKTLRLVAKYADATNVFASSPADVAHKYDVLRAHCEREGRDYNSIERSIIHRMDPGANGENADELVQTLGAYAEAGVQTVLGMVMNSNDLKPLEAMGAKVLPHVAKL